MLELRPDYLRARVARAWIDYIVDTRMPWGTGWLLGGGNKKKALAVMREAADTQDDFYASAEALFGLWDMQVREKNYKAALEPALRLAEMFPKNPEVARFVATREVMPRQANIGELGPGELRLDQVSGDAQAAACVDASLQARLAPSSCARVRLVPVSPMTLVQREESEWGRRNDREARRRRRGAARPER